MSEVARIEPIATPAQVLGGTEGIISLIERVSRDPAADLDKIERLYTMRERAIAAEARTAFLRAFSTLQKDLPHVMRNGVGHNNKKFARFEDVIGAIKQPLSQHGFSLAFRIAQENGLVRITGVLGHANGHAEETAISLPPDKSGSKNEVQAWGSSISYGKRYVALTLLGIATDDDDDGKGAASEAAITEDQVILLRDMILACSAQESDFCKYMGVERLSDLPASQFERARAVLAKKARGSR